MLILIGSDSILYKILTSGKFGCFPGKDREVAVT